MRLLWILLLAGGLWAGEAHFDHLLMNTRDPAAAAAFYAARFACERVGADSVRVEGGWLYFRKARRTPAAEVRSAIWHFGWGAEDMRAAYQAQLAKGTEFATPLTDISDLARSPGFYYAYVKGPDGALIELNTAKHHRFGHLHLLSAEPVAAGEWWVRHFGVSWRPGGREARFYKGFQVGPSASFYLDGVNVIIFPKEYFAGLGELAPTRGQVVDHVGLRVDDLDGTVDRLRQAGVRVLSRARGRPGKRTAMIEGPDRLAIQLVEAGGR